MYVWNIHIYYKYTRSGAVGTFVTNSSCIYTRTNMHMYIYIYICIHMHIIYMYCIYNRSGAVGTYITNRSWQFCLSVVTWKPKFVTDASSCVATRCSVLRLTAPPACGNLEAQVCHTESCVATFCCVLRLTAPPACGNLEAQVCDTLVMCCNKLQCVAADSFAWVTREPRFVAWVCHK